MWLDPQLFLFYSAISKLFNLSGKFYLLSQDWGLLPTDWRAEFVKIDLKAASHQILTLPYRFLSAEKN